MSLNEKEDASMDANWNGITNVCEAGQKSRQSGELCYQNELTSNCMSPYTRQRYRWLQLRLGSN